MNEIEQYLKLYEKPLDELIELAHKVTLDNFKGKVEFCSIISAKTGLCSEDCKYCSQSAKSKAEIKIHPLMSVDEVKNAALSAKENGATKFGIVTSGKSLSKKDFNTVLDMIRAVSSIDNMTCCGCFGILNEDEMKQIKEAGCERYNHNINTSENYYKEICTTHTFKQRVETIKLAQKCGMSVCAGVILGMGEDRIDRINMALTLREINPESVPINILDPIKGTALENYGDKIDSIEILKTFCIFRIILPNSYLRFAGGRMTRLTNDEQRNAMIASINALLVGNYLTTLGSAAEKDKEMVKELGLLKV